MIRELKTLGPPRSPIGVLDAAVVPAEVVVAAEQLADEQHDEQKHEAHESNRGVDEHEPWGR